MEAVSAAPAGCLAEASPASCCAVVVNYRSPEDTLRCVASLREHAPELPVVVVDNDSGDGSAAKMRAAFAADAAVTVIEAARNGGFGAGCNLGIGYALDSRCGLGGVLLLNPDAVATAGLLERLLETARRHPDAGIVGGRVRSGDDERVWFENGRLRWTLSRSHVAAPAGRTEFETQFVTGALMLVDAALLRAGLRFDESYFLYVEDVDLCLQVRARGRSLWVNTAAEVWHRAGGAQSSEAPLVLGLRARQLEHMTRGKVYFARKWLPCLPRLAFLLAAAVLKPLAGVVRGCGVRFLRPYFRGLRAGLRMPLPAASPRDGARRR